MCLFDFEPFATDTSRANARLFTTNISADLVGATPTPKYRMIDAPDLTAAMLDVLENPSDGIGPGITDAGSDDLIYEF